MHHLTCFRLGLSLSLLVAACGSEPEPEPAAPAVDTAGAEAPEPQDGLDVAGLRGTLSQDEVQRALEPRMLKFARCLSRRSGEVEVLSGGIRLAFWVNADGSVEKVQPVESDIGDREAERCMVDVAMDTDFPRPHGGPAEFKWSLEVPLDPEIREPVAWTVADVQQVVDAQGSELVEGCGGGSFGVTVYVDTDGSVLAAGAVTESEVPSETLDCVAEAVSQWSFSSPGSYPAKVSFDLP